METIDLLSGRQFILASQSPRRQNIFAELGLPFQVRPKPVEEDFPAELRAEQIPIYLARKKASAFSGELEPKDILVTADTVVWVNDHVLNKPADRQEAFEMLKEISGNNHFVYTAVCLATSEKEHVFAEGTEVMFHQLSDSEISYYLDRYQPFDKAGAYGIQEFIGYIGIKKVIGDFYNVVGFPVQRFWQELPVILR